jgi:hypothetical protein
MLLISHRGNLKGPDSTLENSPSYIQKALDLGFSVEIDLRTNRTWQASTTISNEYYDGDGTTELELNHPDVSSISAISIDKEYNGTYVSVTPSYIMIYAKEGRIVIDNVRYNPEVTSFIKGNKTVKVTYVYGYSAPDDFVKNLCALMVLQELRPDQKLQDLIDKRISLLRANSIKII